MSTRPSNQLIGRSKEIIETQLYKMSMQIPPSYNKWSHGKAVEFKRRSQQASEMCCSGRATLAELVNCYKSLEVFWK